MILLDTNILVRLANDRDSDYRATHAAISGCWKKNRRLFIANQILQEFWVVATRPANKNGLGFTPAKTDRFLTRFLRLFVCLPDQPTLFETWRILVNAHGIVGLPAYDARIAAFAQTHSLLGLMTYNLADFASFPVALVNPKDPATW
jgi:predicted nucleic acid-binding protein